MPAEKTREIKDEDEVETTETAEDDFSKNMNPNIEDETGGGIEIVFTNTDPNLTHTYSDNVTVSAEAYQIAHVSNMNESAKHNFNEEDEGYVITYKLGFKKKLMTFP